MYRQCSADHWRENEERFWFFLLMQAVPFDPFLRSDTMQQCGMDTNCCTAKNKLLQHNDYV
jgi:hypothetical protein